MITIDHPTDANPETQRRRRITPGDRKRLMSLYRRSGQSAVQFCREHDVCPSSLWRWLGHNRQSGKLSSRAGELVEIPMAALRAPEMASAAVTMQITGVARREFAVGTDPEGLGALVRALTAAVVVCMEGLRVSQIRTLALQHLKKYDLSPLQNGIKSYIDIMNKPQIR